MFGCPEVGDFLELRNPSSRMRFSILLMHVIVVYINFQNLFTQERHSMLQRAQPCMWPCMCSGLPVQPLQQLVYPMNSGQGRGHVTAHQHLRIASIL